MVGPTESSRRDSQDSLNDDERFENELEEAIEKSLEDFRGGGAKTSGTYSYVNFNSNAGYFLDNGFTKGSQDPYDASQILDIVLFHFKTLTDSNSTSVSSRSHYRGLLDTPEYPSKRLNLAEDRLDNNVLSDALRTIFGKDSSRQISDQDIVAWCHQGFRNNVDNNLFWGLVQVNNGSCGVLATVQSFMLRSLLFNHSIFGELTFMLQSKPDREVLSMLHDLFYNFIALRSPEFPREFLYVIPLIESCCSVLYNATDDSVYNIVLYDEFKENIDPIQSLLVESRHSFRSFDNINSVANYLVKNFKKLTGPMGVLSLVLSVVCTRTTDKIRDDMDDPNEPLIATFGHCSQELVNLFLYGRAVTNVFNGEKVIREDPPTFMKLKGIAFQNTVGFLTDLESVRLCRVGCNYKNPLVPIWVVSSNNHYTVLFGLDGSGCLMTQSDMVEQVLDDAWTQVDPEDNRYIRVEALEKLLDLLDLKDSLEDALMEIEQVSELILWVNMVEWYTSKVLSKDYSQKAPVSSFRLFHYNGKDNLTPLHQLTITRDVDVDRDRFHGIDIDMAIVGNARDEHLEIARVVWTRWPKTGVECVALPAARQFV